MPAGDFAVADAYNAPNPTPGSQPPIVTFIKFSVIGIGARTLMIASTNPTREEVTAAIQAYAALHKSLVGLKGST